MTSHRELVAAAEKARVDYDITHPDDSAWAITRNAHVDDLLAILRLHPKSSRDAECCGCGFAWPCPTVQIVADRLTGWSVL